jgi:5-formyltetrahydrofolate cyclo-ligase
MNTKEQLRNRLQHNMSSPARGGGKLAEMLRRQDLYRQARYVFATPGGLLRQIRLNCLLDNKHLVMPSPGLKDGFFCIKPHAVPFRQLGMAMTESGLRRFGRRLEPGKKLAIDLLLTGALAVDREGGRLGNGTGYFDLSCALLSANGWLADDHHILAVVEQSQQVTEPLPREPWDVVMTGVVTVEGCYRFGDQGRKEYPIFWQQLAAGRIKRITPLWQLRNKKQSG